MLLVISLSLSLSLSLSQVYLKHTVEKLIRMKNRLPVRCEPIHVGHL